MRIYNTLSGKLENFNSLKKEEISLYVCGITPYDSAHLGHIKTYSTFDILNRFLCLSGFKVNYIQNITDIDPPLFRRANEKKVSYKNLAESEIKKFKENLIALNILLPKKFVKVSENLDKIINSIEKLFSNNYAYLTDNVYFDSRKFSSFGELSKLNRHQMLENKTFIKTESNLKNKKDSLDFLLWRVTDEFPNWKSPWGNGQPGWHIECSTIINFSLGSQIDIHGGGDDLIFPHHECEIAQSRILNGNASLANYWVHIAPLNIDGKKMSKSTGNLVFAKDILKNYSPEALRLYFASSHYRKSLEYSESKLKKFENLKDLIIKPKNLSYGSKIRDENGKANYKEIISALNDDLNTPLALEKLIDFAKKVEIEGFTNAEEKKMYLKMKWLFGI